RLRDERERACDDHVLRAGADATDYANHLLQIVRAFGKGPSASPALAMARRSQFEGRMLAILDPGLRRGRVSRRAAGMAGALAMLAVLPLAALSPVPRAAAAAAGDDAALAAADSVPLQVRAIAQQYGVPRELAAAIVRAARAEGVELGLAVLLVRIESGFREELVSPRGAVGLTQMLPSTAATLQPGITPAQLAARDTNLRLGFRQLRALLDEYRGDASLALTAYHTGPRAVERMRAAGVASAPAPAASPAASPAALPPRTAASTSPPRSEMDRMVDLVQSDGDKAALLMRTLGASPGLALQLDVIRASERIRSAGDRARVLMSILARRDLGMEALNAILRATDGMDDGDRARVLMGLLEDYPLSLVLMPAFFQATRSLSSDGEHARVLYGVLAQGPRGELELDHVLECAAHIRSGGDKVGVLMAVAGNGPLSANTRTRYLRVVETMESDKDRRTALTGLAGSDE
ncbi:MAG TPA: transglycosylase SLT domain-containing protein, partial [Longimicrobium sp.]|nr:transglycosylase SLT domain-containing protein [Longimicrobium sp.]